MHTRIVALGLLLLALPVAAVAESNTDSKKDKPMTDTATKSFYDFTMTDIDGHDVKLDKYKGKVCLVVNVASKCGLTPQYKELEALYREHKDEGLVILGFPANNFMGQEPGTDSEIKQFCSSKYDVTFDLFAKISVKGKDQHELYQFLTKHPNEEIAGKVEWNFQKYLVDREGNVIAKFGPRTKPDDKKLVSAVEAAIAEKVDG